MGRIWANVFELIAYGGCHGTNFVGRRSLSTGLCAKVVMQSTVGNDDNLFVDPFPEWTANSAYTVVTEAYRSAFPKLRDALCAEPKML